MDENIVALIQTISGILQTIAVLVTLIILIKQYKKFTQQTKVSNYTKQIELLKELRLLRISSPELSKSYTTELNDTTENYTTFGSEVICKEESNSGSRCATSIFCWLFLCYI
jgi:hypothetical protein